MQKLSELFGKICSASERGKKGVLVDLQTISEIRDEFWALKQRAEAAKAKHSELSDWHEKMKSRLLAAEAKLAELQKQEPYGYVVITGTGAKKFSTRHPRLRVTNEPPVAVFTRPAPAVHRVPEGWKLVPVEITQEMVDANFEGVCIGGIQAGYRAMLAAAPEVE